MVNITHHIIFYINKLFILEKKMMIEHNEIDNDNLIVLVSHQSSHIIRFILSNFNYLFILCTVEQIVSNTSNIRLR